MSKLQNKSSLLVVAVCLISANSVVAMERSTRPCVLDIAGLIAAASPATTPSTSTPVVTPSPATTLATMSAAGRTISRAGAVSRAASADTVRSASPSAFTVAIARAAVPVSPAKKVSYRTYIGMPASEAARMATSDSDFAMESAPAKKKRNADHADDSSVGGYASGSSN